MDVVAAVFHISGRLALFRRCGQSHYDGTWEFPGGKVEKGETHEQALLREIREELQLEIRDPKFLSSIESQSGSRNIRLHFFLVDEGSVETSSVLKLIDHDAVFWDTPHNWCCRLQEVSFLDRQFLQDFHPHDHDHDHDQESQVGHGHQHQHHHHVHSLSTNLMWAFLLNFGFCIIEGFGGWFTNSIAIQTDALHDLGDSFAILMAWILQKLSKKKADSNFSYGYGRLEVLGALFTGLILCVGCFIMLGKSLPRLLHPEPVNSGGMLALAILGVAVNGFAALRMSKGHSLNEKMIRWHLIEDLWGWIIVLLGALTIAWLGWYWLDSLLSIFLSFYILYNVSGPLKESLNVLLQRKAPNFLSAEFRDSILAMSEVIDVHHMHAWSLDGSIHVFTGHIVVKPELSLQDLQNVKIRIRRLAEKFGPCETTLEFEFAGEPCLDPNHNS